MKLKKEVELGELGFFILFIAISLFIFISIFFGIKERFQDDYVSSNDLRKAELMSIKEGPSSDE